MNPNKSERVSTYTHAYWLFIALYSSLCRITNYWADSSPKIQIQIPVNHHESSDHGPMGSVISVTISKPSKTCPASTRWSWKMTLSRPGTLHRAAAIGVKPPTHVPGRWSINMSHDMERLSSMVTPKKIWIIVIHLWSSGKPVTNCYYK